MSVTWCAIAANFWVFQQKMIYRYCSRRQQLRQCDECTAGRGINHFKMAQSPASKQDWWLPVKVFAVTDGCTCSRKKFGNSLAWNKEFPEGRWSVQINMALVGQAVTELFCYWCHLKAFKPHARLGESSREIYVLFMYFHFFPNDCKNN